MSKIKILSNLEIRNYENVPDINELEWHKIAGEIDDTDSYFQKLRISTTKIVYVLQYGYFKHF